VVYSLVDLMYTRPRLAKAFAAEERADVWARMSAILLLVCCGVWAWDHRPYALGGLTLVTGLAALPPKWDLLPTVARLVKGLGRGVAGLLNKASGGAPPVTSHLSSTPLTRPPIRSPASPSSPHDFTFGSPILNSTMKFPSALYGSRD
jgi:hypothetical protein